MKIKKIKAPILIKQELIPDALKTPGLSKKLNSFKYEGTVEMKSFPHTVLSAFKKAILLLGPPASGKTRIALLYCAGKNVAIIHGPHYKPDNHFSFSSCNPDTEVVVFDDVNLKKTPIETFFAVITEGIKVEKRGKAPFVIHPQIIITANGNIGDFVGASYDHRFDVFELKRCNTTTIQTNNYKLRAESLKDILEFIIDCKGKIMSYSILSQSLQHAEIDFEFQAQMTLFQIKDILTSNIMLESVNFKYGGNGL